GVVLTEDTGIVGIDLDCCRDPKTGTVDSWAQAIIDEVRSYTEVSPSGTGIRIFAKGRIPGEGRKKGPFEIYNGVTKDGKPGGALPDRDGPAPRWYARQDSEVSQGDCHRLRADLCTPARTGPRRQRRAYGRWQAPARTERR